MTRQFAPMSNVKREPTGGYRRALVGPKRGIIGEIVTYHGWGGVSLQFPGGAVITYADSDTKPVVACAECQSVIQPGDKEFERDDGQPLCRDCYQRLYAARDARDAWLEYGDLRYHRDREDGLRW